MNLAELEQQSKKAWQCYQKDEYNRALEIFKENFAALEQLRQMQKSKQEKHLFISVYLNTVHGMSLTYVDMNEKEKAKEVVNKLHQDFYKSFIKQMNTGQRRHLKYIAGLVLFLCGDFSAAIPMLRAALCDEEQNSSWTEKQLTKIFKQYIICLDLDKGILSAQDKALIKNVHDGKSFKPWQKQLTKIIREDLKHKGPWQKEVDVLFDRLHAQNSDFSLVLKSFSEIIVNIEQEWGKEIYAYNSALIGYMQCVEKLQRVEELQQCIEESHGFIEEKVNASNQDLHLLTHYAEYLESAGFYSIAAKIYREIIKLKPDYEAVYVNYAKFCARQAQKNPSAAAALHNEAKENFEAALEKFKEKRERREVILQQYIIFLTEDVKDSRKACAIFEYYYLRRVEFCDSPTLLLAYGRALEAAHRYVQNDDDSHCAVAIYEKIIALDPINLNAWCGLIMCYQKERDFDRGKEALDRALQHFPKNPRLLHTISVFHKEVVINLEQGKSSLRTAKEFALKARAADPDYVPACRFLGHVSIDSVKDRSNSSSRDHFYQAAQSFRQEGHSRAPGYIEKYGSKEPLPKSIIDGARSSCSSNVGNGQSSAPALGTAGYIPVGYTPLLSAKSGDLHKKHRKRKKALLAHEIPADSSVSQRRKRECEIPADSSVSQRRERECEISADSNISQIPEREYEIQEGSQVSQMQEDSAADNLPNRTVSSFTTVQCLNALGVFAVVAATGVWLVSKTTGDTDSLSVGIGNAGMPGNI